MVVLLLAKQKVVSSNLIIRSSICEPTNCDISHHRESSVHIVLCSLHLAVRISPFQGGYTGSNPVGNANFAGCVLAVMYSLNRMPGVSKPNYPILHLFIEGSSNGRTTDFESVYRGSNPRPSANGTMA